MVNNQNIICAVLRCSIGNYVDTGLIFWLYHSTVRFCAMNINMSETKAKTLNLTSNNVFMSLFPSTNRKKEVGREIFI